MEQPYLGIVLTKIKKLTVEFLLLLLHSLKTHRLNFFRQPFCRKERMIKLWKEEEMVIVLPRKMSQVYHWSFRNKFILFNLI